MKPYEIVIGLETHIQLNTASKIFCSCKADSWGAEPNTNICPVCSGLPGVLPVLNAEVVRKGALLAAAMHAEINPVSYFDRKNYFYPDLPKGYQITQFDEPIGKGGYMDLQRPDGTSRRVRIHKLHLEEDAGKTKIEDGERLVDFNRCGVPLVEMVTEPELRSAEEAAQYLTQLRQLLRWIGVSEADMERGHLRCDANVSIREAGSTVLNTKTEIKNVNSIDAVRLAIIEESKRQIEAVEAGQSIQSYTLDWDADTGTLRKMRSKETEADYRYFREPDLLPVVLAPEEIAEVIASLPELPLERRARFIQDYQLPLTTRISSPANAAFRLLRGKRAAVQRGGGESGFQLDDERPQPPDERHARAPRNCACAWRTWVEIIRMVEDGKINPATGQEPAQQGGSRRGKARGDCGARRFGPIADEDALRAKLRHFG